MRDNPKYVTLLRTQKVNTRNYLVRTMFGALVAELAKLREVGERAVAALEKGAERGPTEDSAARTALARHAEALAQLHKQLEALAARKDSVDPARLLKLEEELAALAGAHRKLRGKVYREPEFHTPAQRDDDSGGEPTIFLGGGVQS